MTKIQKILLVEDQEDDQYLAKRNIARRWPDAQILSAFDGQEAIEVLEANKDCLPDLILLDMNMPRMNGLEFLDAWSKLHKLSVPVVVMLTSSDQRTDKEHAQQYCCVRDYIVKPLNKAAVQQIGEMLDDEAA